MTHARHIGRLVLVAVLGAFAYSVALLGFTEIGCAMGWFVDCSRPLEALLYFVLILGVVGLIVQLVAEPLALVLRGTTFNRIWIFVAVYAALGYALPQLWMAFTSASGFLHPSLLDVPFVIAGTALGLVAWCFRARDSNSTPHADARTSSVLDQPPSARGGERGR